MNFSMNSTSTGAPPKFFTTTNTSNMASNQSNQIFNINNKGNHQLNQNLNSHTSINRNTFQNTNQLNTNSYSYINQSSSNILNNINNNQGTSSNTSNTIGKPNSQDQINLNQINHHRTFKIQDNEIYMIKEQFIKKSNEIIKKSVFSKPHFKPLSVKESRVKNNNSLIEEINQIHNLFQEIYDINNIKDSLKGKVNQKFVDYKEFQAKISNNERKQCEINSSLRLLKGGLNS